MRARIETSMSTNPARQRSETMTWALRMLKRIGVTLLLAGAACFASIAWRLWHLRHLRVVWKEDALPAIEAKAADPSWVKREVALIQSGEAQAGSELLEEGWLSDHMILMENGEWLIYRSHCAKQAPHEVEDIFLAKGSNGKWYYSTCHFCVGMITLRGMQEEAAADIASFAKHYHLREFDGRSNQCLEKTASVPEF